MAFNVRIFGLQGIAQVQQLHLRQFTGAGVFLTEEPTIFGQTISVGAESVLSTADADLKTSLLAIEIPDNQAIRYRVIPAGYPVVDANTDCRRLTGINNIKFAPGWRIAMIDAAGLP